RLRPKDSNSAATAAIPHRMSGTAHRHRNAGIAILGLWRREEMEASMKVTRLGIVLVLMTLASASAFARGGGAAGHGGGTPARGGLPPLILPSAPAPASQALTGPSGPPP